MKDFSINVPSKETGQHSSGIIGENENIPFYEQVANKVVCEGRLKFMGNPEDKICPPYVLIEGKWKLISKRELAKFCKQVLRNFLNPEVLAYIRDEDDNIIKNSITVNGIYIPWKFLENAWKDSFSLSREKRFLMEEIYDTPELYRPEEYFLPPQNILPFHNGYFDLKTGLLHQYGNNGFDGFIYQINADYKTDANPVELPHLFKKLLFNGVSNPAFSLFINEERLNNLLDFLAYTFMPTNPFRKLFLIIGPTASGKSTLVAIMREIFGDLGIHLQSYAIMKQTRYDHELRPDLKAAMDKLWVDLSETDTKQVVDAVTIKSWTGNDPLTFRKPHSDLRMTKVMNCKIFIVTNEFPKLIKYDDIALQDRMVVIDWHNTVAAKDRNADLVSVLTTDDMRNNIATYFTNRAVELLHKNCITVHQTFQFNIKRYFQGHDDDVVKFYDSLFKNIIDCPANPLNMVSTWDLGGLFEQYRQNILGLNVPLSESERRAFENRFAEIAAADKFFFVKREKYTNGHYYRGILVPLEQRQWQFSIPKNANFGNLKMPQIQ